MWKARSLSLLGKVTIVKTLALSKLNFNSSVQLAATGFAKKVGQLVYDFMWNGKTAKIRKPTLMKPYNEEGLKLSYFKTTQKCLTVQ